MLDHIVPMFEISRQQVLGLMDEQRASIAREREKLSTAISHDETEASYAAGAILSSDRENVQQALSLLDDREFSLAIEREHLAAGPSWKISAAQLAELYTRYKAIEFPPIERLRLVIDAEKQIRRAMHNQQFRQARV